MAKFNARKVNPTKTENLAGGSAFSETARLELVSILLTSFVNDKFYRDAEAELDKFRELLPKVGWLFAAKASLYARNKHGMRSITHVVGGEIAQHVKDETWTKRYFKQLYRRPDDMSETVAYFLTRYGKDVGPNTKKSGGMQKRLRSLPWSLKRSIRERLNNIDEYSLAKYKMENREIKMVDLINLVRPNNKAIDALMKGKLKAANTWETNIGEAAKKGETEEQKEELKADAWLELLRKKKLGYIALIRNLRNLSGIKMSSEDMSLLCSQITNEVAIRKSLTMPHQILMAIKVSEKEGFPKKVQDALIGALELSVANIPHFDGETLVAVDCSGSMESAVSSGSAERDQRNRTNSNYVPPLCSEAACIFGAALARQGADVRAFANASYEVPLRSGDSIMTNAEKIRKTTSGGTDMGSIFRNLEKKYDRIIILSDMQSWIGETKTQLQSYTKRVGAKPKMFCWDLRGYGTLQFPENQVFCISGFSKESFDSLFKMDKDKYAVIKEIEAIEV